MLSCLEDPKVDDIDPPNEADDADDGDGDPGPWVTIATFWQSVEAHFARLKIEDADIPCMLVDENMAMQYTIAVGGIKLRVPAAKAEEAQKVLALAAPNSTFRQDEATD